MSEQLISKPNKPWEPTILWQPNNEKNCGQRCVAMITGLPLDYVIKDFGHSKGTMLLEVARRLFLYGWECYGIREYGKIPELAMVCMKNKGRGSHWVIAYKGFMYCTGAGKFPIEKYRENGFSKICWFAEVKMTPSLR